MKKILTKADYLLITAVVLLFAALIVFRPFAGKSGYVEVKTPEGKFIYSLSENARYSFEGIMGDSVIVIQDGEVFFESSPCPNKNCISEGKISKPGAFNACMPNGISISITGESKVDDVSI